MGVKLYFLLAALVPYIVIGTYVMSLGTGYLTTKYANFDINNPSEYECGNPPENYYVMCALVGFTELSALLGCVLLLSSLSELFVYLKSKYFESITHGEYEKSKFML